MNHKQILSVPTNIITGFLGAGKTSAILSLLKQKPTNERWAILVNEFGEIGVDANLIKSQLSNSKDIYIREVSGGCMCCASGLPMQVALNQLLTEAKPDRLLIEPSGLGHPLEVLQILSNQYYKNILSLNKTITLVDARNLTNPRYTGHDIFNQQLNIADIIVGSKYDLYRASDEQALLDFVDTRIKKSIKPVFISHGQLSVDLLIGNTQFQVQTKQKDLTHASSTIVSPEPIPESGFIRAVNKGEGFQSIGWRFSANKTFDHKKLSTFLTQLSVIRIKAVFITTDGIYSYNTVDDGIVESILDKSTLAELALNERNESRIEIINTEINEGWEAKLLNIIN